MSTFIRLYAQPLMLRCRTWTCDYCSGVCSHELRSGYGGMRGILVCENHKAWGLRDIRASWHRANRVWVEDLVAACPELVQAGAELDPTGFAYRQDDGKWFVPMKEFGIEGELEGSIRAKLEAGLYKADEDAFRAAVVLEKERHALAVANAAAATEAKKKEEAAAAAKQRQEAAGRTRLGESKEEMLRRLTAVAGIRRRVAVVDTVDEPEATTATALEHVEDEGEWTKVGH